MGQDGDLISGGFATSGEPPWAHGGSGLFWEAKGWPRWGRDHGGLVQVFSEFALSVTEQKGAVMDGTGPPEVGTSLSLLEPRGPEPLCVPQPQWGHEQTRSSRLGRGLQLLA